MLLELVLVSTSVGTVIGSFELGEPAGWHCVQEWPPVGLPELHWRL